MTYTEYVKITWANFQLKLKGALRKEERQWEQTRLIAYTIYSTSVAGNDRSEIWDFYPLPSDPSENERQRIKKKRESGEQREAKKLLKLYRKEGYLK